MSDPESSPRPKPPSLRDISEASGFSKSAISEALRGNPRIPEVTRDKILKAALDLGYVPDARLTQLMSYLRARSAPRSRAKLAWLQYSVDKTAHRKLPWFAGYWAGAQQQAEKLGYMLEEVTLNELEISPKRALQILRARGIDGVILAPPWHAQAYEKFEWDGFAVAVCGAASEQPSLHMAASCDRESIYLALAKVTAAGYGRPGLWLSVFHNNLSRRETAAGYLLDQLDRDAGSRVPWTPTTTGVPLEVWFREARPDVIICQENTVLPALRANGIRLPDDVGLVHLNVCADVAGWAGIDQNHEAIGQAAVNLVIGQLNRNERNTPRFAMEVLLPGRWVDGWTLPTRDLARVSAAG